MWKPVLVLFVAIVISVSVALSRANQTATPAEENHFLSVLKPGQEVVLDKDESMYRIITGQDAASHPQFQHAIKANVTGVYPDYLVLEETAGEVELEWRLPLHTIASITQFADE